jgi:hypothetical protein
MRLHALAAALMTTAARNPLLVLMHAWLGGSLYDEIHYRDPSDRSTFGITTPELSLGWDPPVVIGDETILTGVEGDRLGRTLLVDVKARRSHTFAGETCELTIKASCSRELGVDVATYDTKCCEGAQHDSDCTGWAENTAKRTLLQKGQTTLLTGWCERSLIPLPRMLTTRWYRDGHRRTTIMHTVTTFTSTYHSWLVNCN